MPFFKNTGKHLSLISLIFCRSLGATVVEMLTKHPPWHELEAMAALFKIANFSRASYVLDDQITREAREFLNCIFVQVEKRPKAKELLKIQWLRHGYG